MTNPRIVMGLVALTALGGGTLNYSAWTSMQDARSKLALERQTKQDPAKIQRDLARTVTDLNDIRSQLSHLEANVSDWAYVPTMLKEVERTGVDHHLKVLGIRPMPAQSEPVPAPSADGTTHPAAKKAYDTLDLEIHGEGSYSDLTEFLEALNHFPKIVAVRTINLTPKSVLPSDVGTAAAKHKNLDALILIRAFLFSAPTGHAVTASDGAKQAPGGAA